MKFETVAKEIFEESVTPSKWREIGLLLKSGEYLKLTPDKQDPNILKVRFRLVTSMRRLFGMTVSAHLRGDELWVKMKTIKASEEGSSK